MESHDPLRASQLRASCAQCLLSNTRLARQVPLLCNFYVHGDITFTHVNKIETMYKRSRENVKVERGSTFKFTRDLSYMSSMLLTRVKLSAFARNNYLREYNPLFPLSSKLSAHSQAGTLRSNDVDGKENVA